LLALRKKREAAEMALIEPALAAGASVTLGALYCIASGTTGNKIPVRSTLTGTASQLATALGVATIYRCDQLGRSRGPFLGPPPQDRQDVFE
jgi:hypothetical protein